MRASRDARLLEYVTRLEARLALADRVVEAARALLGEHSCARCGCDDVRLDREPECVLLRALIEWDEAER